MSKFLKFLALALLAEIIFAFFWLCGNPGMSPANNSNKNTTQENIQSAPPVSQSMNNAAKAPAENNPAPDSTTLPDKILFKVPFTSQAPFANWDARHEEACEETSLIMLHAYLNKINLTPTEAENEIQSMIAFEIKNYGDYKDTNAQQNVKLFNDFYGAPAGGKNLKVVYDFKEEDLKKYLAQGEPVIVPAAGRLLGNPNYTPPGPLYHNLVLIGYSGNTIITNDAGTRKGAGYQYNIDVLYNAIHDFPGNVNNMVQGRKAMIIISKD